MHVKSPGNTVVVALELNGCPLGPVLQPLDGDKATRDRHFAQWETPLAPQDALNIDSGLAVVDDEGRRVLAWQWPRTEWQRWDRALVTGTSLWRDYAVRAEVKPIATAAQPHEDRADCRESYIGIVFRMETLRRHYLFAIEGRRRAVLYRRNDDEWLALAERGFAAPDGYVTLDVDLHGDEIRCNCRELDVRFACRDDAIAAGKAGVRGLGPNRLTQLHVAMNERAKGESERRAHIRMRREEDLGRDVPDAALVRTWDLRDLGGRPVFADFARPGVFDVLVSGEPTRALGVDGDTLWEIPERVDRVVFSSRHTEYGRLLYGLTGQRAGTARVSNWGAAMNNALAAKMVVIRGADGHVLAEREVPQVEDAVQMVLFSPTSGDLSGQGGFDVLLREWRGDAADGGFNLWAYDSALNPLWQGRVRVPYGHQRAIAFFDVDGDGRDEVLAGGTLLSHDGRPVWEHDRAWEMAAIVGAQHYDTVAIGNFADDPNVDPVCFLLGSAAGVYVVDARTGKTRRVHRVGHAQDHNLIRARPDLPGAQVHVVTRWGNMGIQTLFAGNGDRLWTIQPDYLGEGARPVSWDDPDCRRLWVNTTADAQGLYDGYGRRIKRLPQLSDLQAGRATRDVWTFVTRMGDAPQDLLCMAIGDALHVFAPDARAAPAPPRTERK